MKHLLLLALLGLGCATPAASAAADAAGAPHTAPGVLARDPDPRARPTLTYFAQQLEPREQQQLEASAPGICIVSGLTREQALARASEAHAADAYYASEAFLAAASQLVWVQAQSAGVDRYVGLEAFSSGRVVLTNLRGVHGPAIADHAFAMLLCLTRDLAVHLEGRAQGRWEPQGSQLLEPLALAGRTLLVVGLGGIGSEIAQRGHGFGMHVIATRRGDEPGPEWIEHLGKPQELLALLPQADVVALAVPLTEETLGLIDARALAAMKPGSFLVNVARGKVVDTDALVEALRSGRLAGACLDVTEPEPLPAGHPLWGLPQVVITPHVAARAELTSERALELFRENLRRFDAGEALLNVVDPAAGY